MKTTDTKQKSTQIKDKEKYLIELFDKLFKLMDISYDEFNTIFPIKDIEKLRELEKTYPELGISNYTKENEGVTLVSLLATFTDVFCGKRFGVIVEKDRKITGCDLIKF